MLLIVQVEAFKHGFAVRTALGDPGTQQRPFPAAAKVHAATRDLLNDTFVDYLRALTSDDTVLQDTMYGGRCAQAAMICAERVCWAWSGHLQNELVMGLLSHAYLPRGLYRKATGYGCTT
jgi:hypothetical protein